MKIHKVNGCVANKTLVITKPMNFTVLIKLVLTLKSFVAVFTGILIMLCLVYRKLSMLTAIKISMAI